MTNEEIYEVVCYLHEDRHVLATDLADLIEQLQRERDEARGRLVEVEREQPELINIGVHQAVEQARREGFRAGIEAAAEKARILMLGLSKERSDKMQKAIRSLTPTDKPAAPSVADHDIIEFRGIGNYYGTLCLKRENGQDYWTIENYDGHDWAKIPDELGSALRALAAREGE